MATGGTVGSRTAVTQDWSSTARSCPAAVYRLRDVFSRARLGVGSSARAGLHVDSDSRRRCEGMERIGESWACDGSSRVHQIILMIQEHSPLLLLGTYPSELRGWFQLDNQHRLHDDFCWCFTSTPESQRQYRLKLAYYGAILKP